MEKSPKPRVITIAAYAVAFAISFFLVQYFFFQESSGDNYLQQAATEVNKSCPMMVDQETRLDGAEALPGNVFQYNYTLINMVAEGVNIEGIKEILEPQITRQVVKNEQLQVFRDKEVTMAYRYHDKTGAFLFDIQVGPDKYQ
ncbi:hypothetical protein [Mongoliitalea daihaiensis]|uniref:hypothetical protein n=1 Tax=Mongoliitalea daihaiensis TaxID=2782006 RepID=UPI001F3A932A|nr:hypothetical protein [Mongoliitalea daihaiensis]UJP65517.1 hypothetical protein IPZ59_02500 [Mongoliitalea daihaiensis]